MLTLRTTTPAFDRSFDRTFDQLVGSFFDQRRAAGPVVDASWQGDTYVLTVDLPGVPASAVSVEVAGQHVALHASTPSLDWQRTIRLGGRLDPDKVEASHVDGRLTVRIGAVDAPTPRRVEIGTTPLDTPALVAAATDTDEVAADQPTDTNSAG